MSWQMSAKSNEQLIRRLCKSQILKKNNVIEVMLDVDRGNYVLDRGSAYLDQPAPIGYNATISAPHMHAQALEYLDPSIRKNETLSERRILDIGFGSGYLTTCLSLLAGPGSITYAVEHIPELVSFAKRNIQKDHPELLENNRIILMCSDGRLGLPEHGPFDVIHVGAHVVRVPQSLLDQLKVGGRMFIPMGLPQQIYCIQRLSKTDYNYEPLEYVRYVPLTSKEEQLLES